MVDDAIVVLETIAHHVEDGMDRRQAAIQGAGEVGATVLSISLSLIAVFLPILLMQGLVGRLFREFAITLSISILVSLVVSLTLTPMMCAVFLPAQATLLGDRESALTIRQNRYLATVSLIQALGGGWTAADLKGQAGLMSAPTPPITSPNPSSDVLTPKLHL